MEKKAAIMGSVPRLIGEDESLPRNEARGETFWRLGYINESGEFDPDSTWDPSETTSKTTRVACPKCSHAFALQVRDWVNVNRASSELLDRVVAKPSTTPKRDVEMPTSEAEIMVMSIEQLTRLVAQARPFPTAPLPGEPLFADLEGQVRDCLDTIASYEEGHDVSRRRLAAAGLSVRHWNDMAKVLMPVVGIEFHPNPELTT
jgi:hypothetical protein